MQFYPYRRQDAIAYAHRWAYGRNPAYYDYEYIGGDCTNFASQCIYAGSGIMNYTPTYGWYYHNANDKAPAWTGVIYLHQFLTREEPSVGPVCVETTDLAQVQIGDVIQLSFENIGFRHSPVVVETDGTGLPEGILLAAHSYDADWRPLSTYEYEIYRVLHITGYYNAI